jgi:RimJ/RimL family protein N-acetyltransferase
MRITLRPLSWKAGAKLTIEWMETTARRSTRFYEAVSDDGAVVGWVGTRYMPGRLLKPARLVIDGIVVYKPFRGKGLQNDIRLAAVDMCRTKRSARKICVQTYVNVLNTASMRNIVRSGMLPTGAFTDTGATFVNFEGMF